MAGQTIRPLNILPGGYRRDSPQHGHNHLAVTVKGVDQTCGDPTLPKQTGSSSGLPLSPNQSSSQIPVYATKSPPSPPPGPNPPLEVKYPEYSDAAKRVASYAGWPRGVVGQDPRNLALCGFFYIGSADRVRCFSCGTTLRNWEPQDNPHHEHLTWAPKCTFIIRIPEPTETAIAALPDPPLPPTSAVQGATVADGVAKDAPVPKEAVVAKDAANTRETVIVQEVTAPQIGSAPTEGTSTSTSQQTSGNGGNGAGVPMATSDAMKSPLVLAVLEMGVPEDKVREVIRQLGMAFSSAVDLYRAAEVVSVDSR